jgi:hypothetical protein
MTEEIMQIEYNIILVILLKISILLKKPFKNLMMENTNTRTKNDRRQQTINGMKPEMKDELIDKENRYK